MQFNLVYSFFFIFHTYYVIFCEIFALFLAQDFKTKVLTVQKNLLLECLAVPYTSLYPTPYCTINHAVPCTTFLSIWTKQTMNLDKRILSEYYQTILQCSAVLYAIVYIIYSDKPNHSTTFYSLLYYI